MTEPEMTEPKQTAPGWDGRGGPAHVSGYHWVRRADVPGHAMPPVIWTWRADAQVWRWGHREMLPAEMAAHFDWVGPVADHQEVERLQAEVAALRLTLGGKTFGPDVPEPIGCPMPGACAQVAEIGRLKAIIRVNGIRAGATHAEIDEVIRG